MTLVPQHKFGVDGASSAVVTAIETIEQVINTQNSAGSSASTFGGTGNLSVQLSAAGVSPGATGADNVLQVFSIPASAFDVAGRTLQLIASGSFATNGNTKRVKIIVNPSTAVVGSTVGSGGTTVADTGAVTTSGAGWQIGATLAKYGAAGSNTQIAIHNQAQIGAAVASLLAPSTLTATESGAILVAVTGNATTAVLDILANYFEATWQN